jgi:hypothetical protein
MTPRRPNFVAKRHYRVFRDTRSSLPLRAGVLDFVAQRHKLRGLEAR